MAFTYTRSTIVTRALDWIRFRLGDTKSDRTHLDDDEISAMLVGRNLTIESVPDDNAAAVRLAARDCCLAKAAALGDESEIVVTEIGTVKNVAADWFLKLADILENEVGIATAGPLFANPKAYSTTHVVGVDALPDEE